MSMEHAKKMVLVDPEVMNRFNQQQNPISNTISSLDKDMEHILRSSNMTDGEKWMKYNQVLQRYLHFTEKTRQPIHIPIIKEKLPTITEDNELQVKQDQHVLDTMQVLRENTLQAMPRDKRKVTELFYDTLNRDKNITWDEKGHVSINGQKIPGSSIIDLISDAVRNRKGTNPTGWQQFAQLLSELNIPQEYIGNQRRRDFIQQKHIQSPTSSPEKKRKRTALRVIHSLPTKWDKFRF